MTLDQLKAVARSTALQFGLDPALVMAVCEQESAWEPWAVRYEPAFYTRYIESMKLPATEKTMRATSFGLMQCMGQVAREQGYDAKYLTSLCDPANAIEQGCRKLRNCIQRERHEGGSSLADLHAALLRYNGGGNLSYPDEVLARIPKYREG